MKKSIKILSLVLAIALICGAFVVGAFAASVTEYQTATGEKASHAYDFEKNAWAGQKIAGTDSTTSAVTTLDSASICIKGRWGTFEVVKSDYDGNSYVLITDNEKQGTEKPYIAGARVTPAVADGSFENYGIQVVDMDVYLPTGVAPGGWNLEMYMKYYQAETASADGYNGTMQAYRVFDGAASGTVTATGTGGVAYQLSLDGWSHITAIIEARKIFVDASGNEVAEGTEGAIPAAQFYNHVAVNGVIVSSAAHRNTATLVDASSMYESNTRNWFILEPKINFGGNGTTGGQLAFDNLIIRKYSESYADYASLAAALEAGKDAKLDNWAGNLYNVASMPKNLVAKIGETKYDSLQAAVDAAEDGATIDLCTNAYASVTANKLLTINKNGYTANISSNDFIVGETDTSYVLSLPNFRYTQGGVRTCSNGTIHDAIAAADDNSTIICVRPVIIEGANNEEEESILNITKNLTIDLNKQTLTFLQYSKDNIGVASGKTVTFTNGTINAHYKTSETKGHAIFNPGANSTINLVEVNTNSAGLFGSWDNANFAVNVTGGTHTSIGTGDHWGAFFQPRTACAFTATDAQFYFGKQAFIYDSAYSVNASTNPVHTYTFTNCKIIGDSASTNMIAYATNATVITFNGCYISASINPTLSNSDSGAGYTAMTSVNFGAGTYLASGVTVKDGISITRPDGYAIYNINKIIDGVNYTKVVSTEAEMIANHTFTVITGGVETYYDGTFAEVLAAAKATYKASTIKLLKDASYDYKDVETWSETNKRYEYYNYISIELTLDLNTHTLTFIQPQDNYVSLYFNKSGGTFTVKDGTVKAQLADGGLNTFPVFQLSAVGNYVFDNVKSYTAGLVYNYGQTGVNVQFIGGEHHIIGLAANTGGGFVDARANTVVTANGTKFYSDKNRQMFTISSYRTAEGVAKATSLTFTDCYFYNTDASRQLILMNMYTTVALNNCVINTSLSPTRNKEMESSETLDPVAGSITLGSGTIIGSGVSVSDVVTVGSGLVNLYYTTVTEVAYNTYTSGATKVSVTPAYKVGSESSCEYIITIGGSDVYVPEGLTFQKAMELVSSGGTIKLLKNVTYTVGANQTVSKGMIIDLNEKTLHIVQTVVKDCAAFCISTSSQFTITNGYITVESTQQTETNNVGKVFPIIWTNANNTNIVITDVHGTTGGFIYNNFANMTVTVSGGSFHMIAGVSHTNAAFVESRHNCKVNVTDTSFYLEKEELISSLSYKVSSGSECNSQFTFTNCEIYRPSATNKVIQYMNNYTWITFTGCKIHGSLSGTRHDWDISDSNAVANNVAEPTAANIILGEGTTLADGATATAVVADGFNLLYSPDEITFTPAGATYTVTVKVGSVDSPEYRLTIKGAEVLVEDGVLSFAEAIAKADAGTTLYVLADVSVVTPTDATETEKNYATINKALIIDLGGNTLYFSQSIKQYSVISIETASGVEIKSGTIVFNVNESYTTTVTPPEKSSGPLFSIGANNAIVTFTDINAYGGTIAYSYLATGITINFNRGEYHVITTMDLMGAGLVETRANATVNMTGTTVVLDSGVPLLTLNSYKEAGTAKSTAIITDCTILGASETANILPYLNNYGTVKFNNCMIFGSINPSAQPSDKSYGAALGITDPVAGSVVLGNGTYIAANATLKANVVVAESDRAIVETSKSYTFTLTFASGTIYDPANPNFTLESSNEIYAFGFVVGEPPLKNLTVTWYKEDGKTVILVQTVVEGTVGVVAPTYIPGDNNGWYKTGFDGWALLGHTTKVDLASYVVNDNVAFQPAVKTEDSAPTAYLSGAEYNLTLTGNITLNFYLPETPEGVTVLGVYDENGNPISYRGVVIPNGQYRRHYVVNTVGATALTTTSKLRVVFTVMYNGAPVELTQNITISPYRYAKSILADSDKAEPIYSAETHTLIADMVRYSNILSNTVTGSTVTELDELLATYGDLCSTLPYNNGFATYTTSMANLKGYINSVSFEVSQYQPRWVFKFDESMKVVDVKVTLDGYYELPDEGGYNFGELTYELDTEKSIYSGNYITTAYTVATPMYNIDRVITITVTTEAGTVVSGTYSLDNYYANVDATGDELLRVREFLQAFRAFGVTSAGYRYADGIKQEGGAANDFFKCSHTNVGGWTLAGGKYCSDCMTYVFAYADYIANGGKGGQIYSTRDEAYSGKVNSYTAIDLCHDKANALYQTGKKVGCVAGNNVYYLSESLDCNGSISEITIMTDTDWAGAYFVVDDGPFNVTAASYKQAIFGIRGPSVKAPNGTNYENRGTNITAAIAEALGTAEDAVILAPGTTNIGWSCGMPMMISLIDYSQTRYHREGVNASKASTREIILIDEFGNVNPTTPIEWDYVYNTDFNSKPVDSSTTQPCSFMATAYPITAAPIKISGLDDNGNISFTFENVANNAIDVSSYNACERGIMVRGANVTLEGMEHIMTEDDRTDTPRQAYAGFIRPYYAHNTVIKDMLVMNHLGHKDLNGTDLGSYEFGGSDSTYTSWINCKTKNLFWEDGSVTYRGMFGTNRMRNNYLKDCVLNSYDAHSGAYNTTIEDSTFEHINFVGQGDIILKNVVIYADSGKGGIHLRSDYGSRWEGNVYIYGLDLRHSTNYTLKYVDLVTAYYINWDFGYTDKSSTSGNYLPFEIYANDVTISSYTPTAHEYNTANNYTCTKGGIVDEITAVSTLPLGIYIEYEKTLRSKNYDANKDANKQTPTSAIYFTGGTIQSLANTMTPNNAYFANMKIFFDGVEADWCQGTHYDGNNDKICDTCKSAIYCSASHSTGTSHSTCGTCGALTGKHTDTDTDSSDGNKVCDTCGMTINCSADHSGNSSGKCSTCSATIKKIGSCVTGDTLVTLADGTTARIDSLKDGDMILAWNFETGRIEAVPVAKWVNHGYDNNTVIVLNFEDGTTVKVVNAHQFFNVEANDFITIDLETVASYVGKSFAGINANGEIVTKKLVSYESYVEYNEAYATVSAYHYNIFVEGMLTMDFKDCDLGLFRGFEIGADMKFDEEQMAEDIAKYGLYVYEDFADYISEETFELFNFKYMKVAAGKGYSSYEHIVTLIKRYGLK